MAEIPTFDVDFINERIEKLLATDLNMERMSMAELKEIRDFVKDLVAMNRAGILRIAPDEVVPIATLYAIVVDEYRNRRVLEVATEKTWAQLQMTLDTC